MSVDGEEQIDTTSGKPKAPGGDSEVDSSGLTSDCTHGPGGKCLNCLGVTKENAKEVVKKCMHPAGAKCVNCMGLDENNFSRVGYSCQCVPGSG